MEVQTYTQNMKDDRNIVSNSRSTTTPKHQQWSHSFKSSTVKLRSRHHHQSVNTKQHRRSKRKLRPITAVHTTVRPKIKKIHPFENKFVHSNESFYSFSTILAARHHHNALNKLSITPKTVHKSNILKRPNAATNISSRESPFPLQSSDNSWDNEDSARHLTKRSGPVYHNDNDVKVKDGWPDWTSFENEHHQNRKKKKKCTRPCIILSIIIALLLVIIGIVILIVLLTRPKTNTTINRTAVLRWNSTGITVAGITGRKGNASNLLNFPFGILIDYSYTLYITDTYNNRVQKYLNGTSSGTTVAGQADGSSNTTSIYLNSPCDVAVDSSGNVYVADTFNNRIQFWSSGSSSGITIIGNGSMGTATNQLNQAYGLFRDPDSGILYIADTNNYRVLRLISGESSGTVVAGGNGGGTSNTQLNSPLGLYFDSPSNSMLIANAGINSIVQWVLGASSWTLVAGNASSTSGSTSTQLNFPVDVTLDPMGNIYVADTNNHRIQFFSAGQSIGETIAGMTSTSGNSSILLMQPTSVALDNQLNLYVSDAGNNRIQKFLRY